MRTARRLWRAKHRQSVALAIGENAGRPSLRGAIQMKSWASCAKNMMMLMIAQLAR
jgi:hypothetical protein